MTFSTLLQALGFHANRQPDKLMIADGECELTYAQFLHAVNGFACYLRRKGVGSGERILVQNTQAAAFAIAVLGAQANGCVSVPLDGDAPPERLLQVTELTNARFCVLKNELRNTVDMILVSDVIAIANTEPICELPEIKPDSTSEILFTTGTTGTSKGVVHTYRSEVACAENQVHSLRAEPEDVWTIPMPLSHAMGLRKLHAAILSGGTVVLVNGVAFAGHFFERMDRYGVTILSLVPAYLSILLRMWSAELAKYNTRLHCIRLGSAAVSQKDLEQLANVLPDVTVCICYGASEASDCAYYRYTGKPGKAGCVGRVNINANIRLLTEDGTEITAPDTPGRIEISGSNLMSGYYGDDALTARVMNNRRLVSGDIGYFGADGLLYLIGRADEVINSGGYKISPDEIEEAARSIQGIANCACIPTPDPILGQIPMLAVVMLRGYTFSAEAIYQNLSASLEKHLLPRIIVETDTIPKTASGKPRRLLLAKRLLPEE